MRGEVRFLEAAKSLTGRGSAAGFDSRQACVFVNGWTGFETLTGFEALTDFSGRAEVASRGDDPISFFSNGLNDLPADEANRL